MSLFGSLLGDMEDDFFGMRQMRHMNHMMNSMNSLFVDPFGMMGNMGMGGHLALMGPQRHGPNLMSLMPQMPGMPNMNRLLAGDMNNIGGGSSFSSSTVFMSGGPGGRPQVIRSTSSTKVGPDGIKETKSTLEDSRSGTKKMSIGHHIGERAHVMEREQNTISGDTEETQEYINIEEDEAEEFDREFQEKAGGYLARQHNRPLAITNGSSHSTSPPILALTAAPAPQTLSPPPHQHSQRRKGARSSPLATPHISSVREVYSPTQPSRRRLQPPHQKRHKHPQQ